MTDTGQPFGAIRGGGLAINDGAIAWLGPLSDLPDAPEHLADEVFQAAGGWLTPGLIDCHTHLVFGGDRVNEFELRNAGADYRSIAEAGGGIHNTVTATRATSQDQLISNAMGRLRHLLAEGVTTVEVKSGYGLSVDDELTLMTAIRRLGERHPIEVKATLMAAHAVPAEFEGRSDDYVDLICQEIIPETARRGLADAVDAFCEPIAFSPEQVRRVFTAAADANLPVKLHADQLSDSGGAALAAEFGALSADHLEFASEAGITALAEAGVVAGLLPGAFYFLGETRRPPVASLREHGVAMAVATDCNPGSSPMSSIIMAMNLAATQFGLSAEECLRGTTLNAARALSMDRQVGTLEVGKQADLALWSIDDPAELPYWIGGRRCRRVYKAGQVVF